MNFLVLKTHFLCWYVSHSLYTCDIPFSLTHPYSPLPLCRPSLHGCWITAVFVFSALKFKLMRNKFTFHVFPIERLYWFFKKKFLKSLIATFSGLLCVCTICSIWRHLYSVLLQSSIPASFPVSNQFMIGDYVMPGNVIYPSQSQSRKSEAVWQ